MKSGERAWHAALGLPRGDLDFAAQNARHRAADREPEPPLARMHQRQRAVEPAVALASLGAEPALHQILRVEMRARAIAVAGGGNDQQLAFAVIRVERRERRMKPEHLVERDRAARLARRL